MTLTVSIDDQIKFVQDLMGTFYKINSYDRSEGLDCWSCTKLIQKELFGRDLPILNIPDNTVQSYVNTVLEGERLVNWMQIEEPVHGCIVELSRGKIPHHVGTYIWIPEYKVKGLLHCLSGIGVIFDPWITLKAAGWRRFTYNVPNTRST